MNPYECEIGPYVPSACTECGEHHPPCEHFQCFRCGEAIAPGHEWWLTKWKKGPWSNLGEPRLVGSGRWLANQPFHHACASEQLEVSRG